MRHAGIPDAASVQEVLLWQTATISTMYRIIAKALKLKVRPRTAFLLHPRAKMRFHGRRITRCDDTSTCISTAAAQNSFIHPNAYRGGCRSPSCQTACGWGTPGSVCYHVFRAL